MKKKTKVKPRKEKETGKRKMKERDKIQKVSCNSRTSNFASWAEFLRDENNLMHYMAVTRVGEGKGKKRWEKRFKLMP